MLVIIAVCGAVAGGAGDRAVLPLVTLLALAAGLAAPVAVLRSKANRRKNAFEAQLPELLSVWASALRAGRSFAQALDTIVEEAADPALSEFRRAQQQVRLGVPIEQALDEMAQRLGSESFELVVLTTDVQRRIGGNVAEIFDQVSETVRKRQQFSRAGAGPDRDGRDVGPRAAGHAVRPRGHAHPGQHRLHDRRCTPPASATC